MSLKFTVLEEETPGKGQAEPEIEVSDSFPGCYFSCSTLTSSMHGAFRFSRFSVCIPAIFNAERAKLSTRPTVMRKIMHFELF